MPWIIILKMVKVMIENLFQSLNRTLPQSNYRASFTPWRAGTPVQQHIGGIVLFLKIIFEKIQNLDYSIFLFLILNLRLFISTFAT